VAYRGFFGVYGRNFFRGNSINIVEDRGHRERRSGGGSPLVSGSTQFGNEWNPLFWLGCYGCIFHRFGNSAYFCQNFGFSEFRRGVWTPQNPSVRHCCVGNLAILNIYVKLPTVHNVKLTSHLLTKTTRCHDCDRAGVVLGTSGFIGTKRQHRLNCSNLYEAVNRHRCLGQYCGVGEIYRSLLTTWKFVAWIFGETVTSQCMVV
jgi:hypothetical protein